MLFDSFRAAIHKDRAQFFLDVPSGPFFGFNRPGVQKSEGQIRSWWSQGMASSYLEDVLRAAGYDVKDTGGKSEEEEKHRERKAQRRDEL